MEHKLLTVIDNLIPITAFTNNQTAASNITPTIIKRKINLRKRLLKKLKHNPDTETKIRIKNLATEIKQHYNNTKRKKVRQGIIPGNSKTLWDSVRIAKDQNIEFLNVNYFYTEIKIN